ncbi:ATP-dependent dethiobiotin synthetase BioD [Helicobacter sp. MIT 05-5294]|uniref:ATP-dependent dethiobiotin synthetase BioD n=1 Tax=Helicobacter sp. MIT 05-5294 TaxID=1548150 RepID=UPI00051FEE5E|nr:ATP-dependent dethiobiotin synthetase BioD [Helicobacter sp. MIT 05-5294]TLD87307.1 ATP-dependent dethiobiotin synthetase BioD [Helicobacter sp. MIT 05-5294]
MQIFIAGSHTDIGKTSVSAALCYALGLDYFKLVQAGVPTDSQRIQSLSPKTKIFPNGITLQTPASPHIGMQKENVHYDGLQIPLPLSENLLVESAGGLFTPLDQQNCMIDFLGFSKLPCLLVGGYYLGGINHILLSIDALKTREIPLLGLIVSKDSNPQMDAFIESYASIKIAHFPQYHDLTSFQENAQKLKSQMLKSKMI